MKVVPTSRWAFFLSALIISSLGVAAVGQFLVFPLLDHLTSPIGDSRDTLYPAVFLALCAAGGLVSAWRFACRFGESIFDVVPFVLFTASASLGFLMLFLATIKT